MEINVAVLGSTGSIGTQTLDVLRALGQKPVSLTAHRNILLLEEQAREFHPQLVAVSDEHAAAELRIRLADTDIPVAGGDAGLLEAVCLPAVKVVLTAMVGMAGLPPTLAAIEAGKDIALANKETLVCAGTHVMARAKQKGVRILPVDSEHSAIFQCLAGGQDRGAVKKLWLTASGGPFYGFTMEQLSAITPQQALKHPNWSMGAKVSIDSASLFNKGLECIEAYHLFGLSTAQIGVVVHRQSIVHSMVEFQDNALLAQCGAPDMRLPIQYALTYPRRLPCPAAPLDFSQTMSWTFAPPDLATFPCLPLAVEAASRGDAAACALNAADEVAVKRFLAGEIGFLDIPRLVALGLESAPDIPSPDLQTLLEIDAETRRLMEKG